MVLVEEVGLEAMEELEVFELDNAYRGMTRSML